MPVDCVLAVLNDFDERLDDKNWVCGVINWLVVRTTIDALKDLEFQLVCGVIIEKQG